MVYQVRKQLLEEGLLAGQCLDRRIPNTSTLSNEIAARKDDRNAHHTKAD